MSVDGKSLNIEIERSAHNRKGNMGCSFQMIGILCQMQLTCSLNIHETKAGGIQTQCGLCSKILSQMTRTEFIMSILCIFQSIWQMKSHHTVTARKKTGETEETCTIRFEVLLGPMKLQQNHH